MRIYLNGSVHELPRVRRFAQLLEQSGLVLFDDPWWQSIDASFAPTPDERKKPEYAARAELTKHAVESCELYWVLAPMPGYGTYTGERPHERVLTVVTGSGATRRKRETINRWPYRIDFEDPKDEVGLTFILELQEE